MTSNLPVGVAVAGAMRCAHPAPIKLAQATTTQKARIVPVVILYCGRMAEQTTAPPGDAEQAAEPDLTRSYVLIVIVEVLVIGGLYWVSRHFS